MTMFCCCNLCHSFERSKQKKDEQKIKRERDGGSSINIAENQYSDYVLLVM